MNKNQKKILESLKDKDPSKFFSNEEIATESKLSTTTVGSECYKMREVKLLEAGPAQLGVELTNRITFAGQSKLDEEKLSLQNLNWTKIGTVTAIILSIAAITISVLK